MSGTSVWQLERKTEGFLLLLGQQPEDGDVCRCLLPPSQALGQGLSFYVSRDKITQKMEYFLERFRGFWVKQG